MNYNICYFCHDQCDIYCKCNHCSTNDIEVYRYSDMVHVYISNLHFRLHIQENYTIVHDQFDYDIGAIVTFNSLLSIPTIKEKAKTLLLLL